jgi:glutamate synthase domain-containing protein 1/glutamate synthase domain-containing protein 3
MHNRGNGKGGGIAMVGLDSQQARVDASTLDSHYMLQVAFLDPSSRQEIEAQFIQPHFEIAQAYALDHVDDYRQISGLEVQPPDVWRYFVRVNPDRLEQFGQAQGLLGQPGKPDLAPRALEDEFIYQNSYRLNQQFYASLGDKRAFVVSHGRNLSVLKIVGYAEDVVEYYRLEDQTAHVWIAHQRYPTKGRVWHPGGAHPFIGLNEALVHNGDFANYHAVSEYLRQRNIGQLFLTDTEVAVQLFDLWDRVYGYPLEITLDAMAPTSEHDFQMLPPQRQALYRAVQRTHMHGSPDGPWFFIVARSTAAEKYSEGQSALTGQRFELLGITDTSMLRPQVFAMYENNLGGVNGSVEKVQIGLVASERQAINACLRSLSAEDDRFQPIADRYWVARGGSHTDGGAFRFVVEAETGTAGKQSRLDCTNKFGALVTVDPRRQHIDRKMLDLTQATPALQSEWQNNSLHAFDDGGETTFCQWLEARLPGMNWDALAWGMGVLVEFAGQGAQEWEYVRQTLSLLRDRRMNLGEKKQSSLLALVDDHLRRVFGLAPLFNDFGEGFSRRLTWDSRHTLAAPEIAAGRIPPVLIIDAAGFPPEGEEAAARYIVQGYKLGWKHIVAYNWSGGRFAACGLGPDSFGLRLDLYGDVGDYAASGLDGAEVHLHGDGQDQLGQILKRGKLVIHGDAGQTFLYGAKGGEVYVLGSAAGRPLINAVGRPRAVINGTCLDYLAESFMAGDPYQGGGFVILNGVAYNERGALVELETPYPGGNLFSLASGGAIYLRDPHRRVTDDQLNGGVFGEISTADWELIEPYLQENERLFGVRIADLLLVDGVLCKPVEVYRKVEVRGANILRETANQ